ncbi:MAG: hypothetical protein JXB03_07785 [Spirochaetales bacterium]|nr:hypothetical protein [Spirochaetales bacterium]
MKKKLVSIGLFLSVLANGVYATDMEECFYLNSYFNKTPQETHGKINEYEARIAVDADDYYSYLAIAILYTALSSPMDSPEEGASKKAVEYSEAFEKHEKNNPVAMTYYGIGCSLVSRDSRNPFTQLKMVKKAIRILDAAVDLSQGQTRHWFVRYMRGNFYINLPGSFGKREAAEEDFAYIRDYYPAHPEIEGYMCNAFYHLGEIEKAFGRLDSAVDYWKKSVAIHDRLGLNAREGEQAAERLQLFAD